MNSLIVKVSKEDKFLTKKIIGIKSLNISEYVLINNAKGKNPKVIVNTTNKEHTNSKNETKIELNKISKNSIS